MNTEINKKIWVDKIIDNLCSVKMSIDDMEKIDELVQNFLK